MREVAPGVWHWEAKHPEWSGPESEALRHRVGMVAGTASEEAPILVSSYAIDDGDRLLLVDPLAVPRGIEDLAAGRDTVVVLTSPWHERDARSLVERLDLTVFTPAPDEGSPDVAWLASTPSRNAHFYAAGDRLPVGVQALSGRLPNDLVLWVERQRAVVAGDTLVDFGQGLEIPLEWLPADTTRERVAEGLKLLLNLPVGIVLATHGGPTSSAALRRALG